MMTRTLICLLLAWGCLAISAEGERDRPDIVLVMVDDLGYADLGCYGSEIETPNLDRLAEEGVRFTQFYNTAKCAPTRASLLSGRYYPEATFTPPHRNSVTIAEVLKQQEYVTLMSGKWHLYGVPWEQGFDRYFGHLSGMTNFFVGNDTFRLDGEKFDVPQEGFYATDAITDYALTFLEESVGEDDPFFLYVAYNAPHYPLQAKEADVRKYWNNYDVGWDVIRERRFERMRRLGVIAEDTLLSPRPENVPAWEDLTEAQRKEHRLTMAAYAGMVDCVDQNLGRLIGRLKEMGRWENTLFLFLSDNGACPFQRTQERTRREFLMPWNPESFWTYDEGWAHVGNTPLRWFKQNQHEGGISSPLIAHWPNRLGKPGRIATEPGHVVDVAATLYDVAGVAYPKEYGGAKIGDLRGVSLVTAFEGKGLSREPYFWQYFRNNRALRDGDWKVVMERRQQEWELYNIARDRSEMNDLAAKMPDRLERMVEEYEALTSEIQANAEEVKAITGQP